MDFCLNRLSMALPLLLVAGCGLSSDDRNTSSSTKEPWAYEYSVNGCTTGKVRGEGRESHCQALQNDALNNHCARETRGLMLQKLCAAQGQADSPSAGPTPDEPTPSPQGQLSCGYRFNALEDSSAIRAVLSGTWISRSPGILSEIGRAETRSWKQGLYFDFTGSELSEVRVYHRLNGADLVPVAISPPYRGTQVMFSEPVASGTFQGWHLVQWNLANGLCMTIAVGFERRAGEYAQTLRMIGPRTVQSSSGQRSLGVADFFNDSVGHPRDFLSWGLDEMPRWEPIGL